MAPFARRRRSERESTDQLTRQHGVLKSFGPEKCPLRRRRREAFPGAALGANSSTASSHTRRTLRPRARAAARGATSIKPSIGTSRNQDDRRRGQPRRRGGHQLGRKRHEAMPPRGQRGGVPRAPASRRRVRRTRAARYVRGRVAAAPRLRRGYSVAWREVAAAPRPRRGNLVETGGRLRYTTRAADETAA